jgi:hypothetical protein
MSVSEPLMTHRKSLKKLSKRRCVSCFITLVKGWRLGLDGNTRSSNAISVGVFNGSIEWLNDNHGYFSTGNSWA